LRSVVNQYSILREFHLEFAHLTSLSSIASSLNLLSSAYVSTARWSAFAQLTPTTESRRLLWGFRSSRSSGRSSGHPPRSSGHDADVFAL